MCTASNEMRSEQKGNEMTTIQPAGEELRKAVKWISEMRQDEPEKKISTLIEEACIRFDLTPVDAEWLQKTLQEK